MPVYSCQLCNFSTPIKGKYEAHLKTKKHLTNVQKSEESQDHERQPSPPRQPSMPRAESEPRQPSMPESCKECQHTVESLLIKDNEEWKARYDALQKRYDELQKRYDIVVDSIIARGSNVAAATPIAPIVHVVTAPAPEPKPEKEKVKRINENSLDDMKTNLVTFMEKIVVPDETAKNVLNDPKTTKSAIHRLVQAAVDETPPEERGMITTDVARKTMWVRDAKQDKWVKRDGTIDIQQNVLNKIMDALDRVYGRKLVTDERIGELYVNWTPYFTKRDFDKGLMEMFKV